MEKINCDEDLKSKLRGYNEAIDNFLKELEKYGYPKSYNEAIDNFFKELEKYEEKDGWLRLKMSSIYEIAEELKKIL